MIEKTGLRLGAVVGFLDETLDIGGYSGDSSIKGLQVEGSSRIRKVSLAVDACERSIRGAIRNGSELLITHHGLLWGQAEPITGVMAHRMRLLLDKRVSLYSAHLPLDCHADVGNNASLSKLLGIKKTHPFGDYHGIKIGLAGKLPRPISVRSLVSKLRRLLGAPIRTFAFGPGISRKIGIVSGGGAQFALGAAAEGCDTLLTGETSHSAIHPARESGINLVCAGHYATETLGVKALGKLIAESLGLQTKFIDIPTGL